MMTNVKQIIGGPEKEHFSLIKLSYIKVPLLCSGKVLQKLSLENPLPKHLIHLKRIKRSEDDSYTMILLSPDYIDGSVDGIYTVDGIVDVPSRMALNVEELMEWKKASYWPTVFHDLQKNERGMIEKVTQLIFDVMGRYLVVPEIIIFNMDGKELYSKRNQYSNTLFNDAILSAINDFSLLSFANESDESESDESVQYLLTNYIIFTKKEPNLMSAMALLHSRVKVVVWMNEDEDRGALGSKLFLPAIPKINHRYHVFRYSS